MENCNKCGRPSVYRSTLIVNGVSQKTSLCRECAIKEGVFNTSPTSLFDDMFMSFADFLPFEKVENVSCPVCKTSLREFKSSGRFGCPNCYEAFREEIAKIVKRIAPFDKHQQDAIGTKSNARAKKQTPEEKIKALRAEMKLAVQEERYEDAAKIKNKS